MMSNHNLFSWLDFMKLAFWSQLTTHQLKSVASNSSPPEHRLHPRFKPTQPVADRIVRAIRHRLRLLHRSESNFFVLGATGNVRRTLRPCLLSHLLSKPTSPEAVAGAGVRERFHQLFLQAREGSSRPAIEIEDGTMCPVCLDEMGRGEKVVACGTCRNPIHEECLLTWKRTRGRRSASCVICRARWSNRTDQERYLNLAAYVSDDDEVAEGDGGLWGD
ncbi:hypothetical protein CK203_003822 [Vitis vinifera]|uniref:RING-type domain-containing protein n=1 Tax=Vitis vinifera TaxID=29760 RepID=A0A438K8T8_VITVI|nr:hypothetical protein CK203_003822 [Vitis vinifera]